MRGVFPLALKVGFPIPISGIEVEVDGGVVTAPVKLAIVDAGR